MIQEFFMGRVSNKVIQQARDRIIWGCELGGHRRRTERSMVHEAA